MTAENDLCAGVSIRALRGGTLELAQVPTVTFAKAISTVGYYRVSLRQNVPRLIKAAVQYLIRYRESRATVHILHAVHGTRDLLRPFNRKRSEWIPATHAAHAGVALDTNVFSNETCQQGC
jgi:hypothetical protein